MNIISKYKIKKLEKYFNRKIVWTNPLGNYNYYMGNFTIAYSSILFIIGGIFVSLLPILLTLSFFKPTMFFGVILFISFPTSFFLMLLFFYNYSYFDNLYFQFKKKRMQKLLVKIQKIPVKNDDSIQLIQFKLDTPKLFYKFKKITENLLFDEIYKNFNGLQYPTILNADVAYEDKKFGIGGNLKKCAVFLMLENRETQIAFSSFLKMEEMRLDLILTVLKELSDNHYTLNEAVQKEIITKEIYAELFQPFFKEFELLISNCIDKKEQTEKMKQNLKDADTKLKMNSVLETIKLLY